MTVISAMKFNDKEAAIVADEQLTYGHRKIKLSTKLTTYELTGLQAIVGVTGTYDILMEVVGKLRGLAQDPKIGIATAEDVAEALAESLNAVHHRVINGLCRAWWGLSEQQVQIDEVTDEHGNKHELSPFILRQYHDLVMRKIEDSGWINNAIVVLARDATGINIFNINGEIGTYTFQPIPYNTVGSGSDSADLVLKQFYERISWEKRNEIEPTDGLAALINATDRACIDNIGVEGTPLIRILMPDGTIRVPAENSSRLATEIVRAERDGFLSAGFRRSALGALFYENVDCLEVEKTMWETVGKNRHRLDRRLRGYK